MKEFKIGTSSITDRNDICIAHYLHDINHYDCLTPEEETQLARDIKAGGRKAENAKKKLIEGNLRFVVSVANQYKTNTMPLADIIAEGNIGLIRAAETFDETRGFKFISYAVWWIRQSIMAAIESNNNAVRLPSNQQRLLKEYRKLDNEMMQREQRHITIDEFCQTMNVDSNMARMIYNASLSAVKMDAPMTDDSDATLGDMMDSGFRTDKDIENVSLQHDLQQALLKCLKDRELDIVCHYYGFGCEAESFERISVRMGLSRERTRQICLNAIAKIRNSKYSKELLMYLAA